MQVSRLTVDLVKYRLYCGKKMCIWDPFRRKIAIFDHHSLSLILLLLFLFSLFLFLSFIFDLT
jgi:hypothetical protein